jgi:RpiB/LacA/LacB family sugar-phosphate isomerase
MRSNKLRIVVGTDDAGSDDKDVLQKDLQISDHVAEIIDVGVDAGDDDNVTAYPNVAIAAAELIAAGKADRALLVCGTGLGVAIAANKVYGIRAVTARMTAFPSNVLSSATMRRYSHSVSASLVSNSPDGSHGNGSLTISMHRRHQQTRCAS